MSTYIIYNYISSNRTLIGVAVAVAGNITISIALNCQKLAHIRLQQQQPNVTFDHDSDDDLESIESSPDSHYLQDTDDDDLKKQNTYHRDQLNQPKDFNRFSEIDPASPSPRQARVISKSILPKDGGISGASMAKVSSQDNSVVASNVDSSQMASSENNSPAESNVLPMSTIHASPTVPKLDGVDDSITSPSPQSRGGPNLLFLQSKLWWLGIALMTIGECGNFISYGFAPASLVAPLGAVALLSNVIISPILLKERFKPSDIGGILLAVIGAVTVVYSSKQTDLSLGPSALLEAIKRLEFVIYSIIALVLASILIFLSSTALADEWILIDVGACAVFGGFTVLSTKAISSIISRGQPIKALRYPLTYCLMVVLVLTAVIQITYLNRALQRFDSREVIPTQFVFFTISAIVGSAILYRDFENMEAHRLINFFFGCLTTFAGVFVLTKRGSDTDMEELDDQLLPQEIDEEQDVIIGYTSVHNITIPEEGTSLLGSSWNERNDREASGNTFGSIGSTRSYRAGKVSFGMAANTPTRRQTHTPSKAMMPLSMDRQRSLTRSPRSTPLLPLSRSLNDRIQAFPSTSRSTSGLYNADGTGCLSTSPPPGSGGGGLRTPRLSLIGIDRPTSLGLSSGHYLLLATTPPIVNLNALYPSSNTPNQSTNNQRHFGYGSTVSPPPNLLTLPTTTPIKWQPSTKSPPLS